MTVTYINEDAELLGKIAAGNQQCFSWMVNKYWNNVYSHSLAYTKCPQQAQEITQDVFLRVWTKRAALMGVKDFKNYLFILSRNQIINCIKKKLEDITSYPILDSTETLLVPDQQLEYKETLNTILEGIEKLPPARKSVFKMSRLEGKSYEDIASSLNISKNTVKEHIVLSLNFLRIYIHLHAHNVGTMMVVFCLLGK